MPLNFTLAKTEAEACASLASELSSLLARVKQFLDHNSDLSVNWVPATKVFTADNTTDTCTSNGHGLANGQKARVTSSGALPAGLLANTDYWLVGVATNTFQLATSKGGAAFNFTDNGSGTLTLHPVPDYLTEDSDGNLFGLLYSRQAVSNAIGSLDQFRALLENAAASQGDHLGNFNQLSRPLG